MDFFTHQDEARKKTGFLLVYFTLAVIFIVFSVYLVLLLLLMLGDSQYGDGESSLYQQALDLRLLLYIAGGTSLVVLTGSLFKIAVLRRGGSFIATSLGGQPLLPNTRDRAEKRLLNIVEEMSIAAGVAIPPVYIMRNEKGINAFAAGFTSGDAVIGVTRGLLDHLNRDELQGVIAHEFSHILNGDMRLNIRLMGVLHGILLIAIIGEHVLRGSGRTREKGAALGVVLGLSLMVVGFSGIFFGKLIKSAISRQREFLADASAVQFTRNPEGIAGALKKIGGLSKGGQMRHPNAESASHMFFGNAMRAGFINILATHPPLKQRITRLDPHFDGVYPELKQPRKRKRKEAKKEPPPFPLSKAGMPNPFGDVLPEGMLFPMMAVQATTVDEMVRRVGTLEEGQIAAAKALIDSIPEEIKAAASDPLDSTALFLSMLLDADESVRNDQWAAIRKRSFPGIPESTGRWADAVQSMPAETRLPLVELTLAGLQQLSPQQYATVKALVIELTEADRSISLFEYALRHIFFQRCEARFEKPRQRHAQIYSVRGVTDECSRLLTLLARVGAETEADAEKAFIAGAKLLDSPGATYSYLSAGESSLSHVDAALDKLRITSAPVKKLLISACYVCLIHDKKITSEEAELFRAVAAALDIPVPLWLTVQAKSEAVKEKLHDA